MVTCHILIGKTSNPNTQTVILPKIIKSQRSSQVQGRMFHACPNTRGSGLSFCRNSPWQKILGTYRTHPSTWRWRHCLDCWKIWSLVCRHGSLCLQEQQLGDPVKEMRSIQHRSISNATSQYSTYSPGEGGSEQSRNKWKWSHDQELTQATNLSAVHFCTRSPTNTIMAPSFGVAGRYSPLGAFTYTQTVRRQGHKLTNGTICKSKLFNITSIAE